MPPPDLSIAPSRTDSPRFWAPRSARSQSVSSDRPSTAGHLSLLAPPANIAPEAAFIAASAASQIVTNDHDAQADTWFDQHGLQPSGETALVSPPAMRLVNNFLDQLLFNCLSLARSTALAPLRLAVLDTLKPKLAHAAIRGAEQELQEYLGGSEDEDLLAAAAFHADASSDWDLELAWKRTRLRCMVYSSLGDMEEDDEDFYTHQEHLAAADDDPLVVSPAVAIFLTAILEFMGEQILLVAGQAAYHRLRLRQARDEREGRHVQPELADRIVVEDHDVEKSALDRTLGRLWRGWKKRVRSPPGSISLSRAWSLDDPEPETTMPSVGAILAHRSHAADIPLPMSENDVCEIEVPGLAAQSDDDDDEPGNPATAAAKARPTSLLIFKYPMRGPPTPAPSQPNSPRAWVPQTRKRSYSLPSPSTANLASVATVRRPVEPAVSRPSTRATSSLSSEREPAHAHAATAGMASGVSSIDVGTEDSNASDTEDVVIEEPRIMTSSRISMGGRISPEEQLRLATDRAASAPSLRLVDHAKSPTARVMEDGIPRVITISRSNSINSPSGAPSPRKISSPTVRHGSPLAPHGLRPETSMLESASDTEEHMSSASAVSLVSAMSESDNPARQGMEAPSNAPLNQTPRMSVVPADLALAMQGVDLDPSPTSQHYVPPPLDKEPVVVSAPQHTRRQDLRIVPTRSADIPPPLSPLREAAEGMYLRFLV